MNWVISALPGTPYLIVDPEASSTDFAVYATGFIGTDSVFDGFVISGFGSDIGAVSLVNSTPNLSASLSHSVREVFVNLAGNNTRDGRFTLSISVVRSPRRGCFP